MMKSARARRAEPVIRQQDGLTPSIFGLERSALSIASKPLEEKPQADKVNRVVFGSYLMRAP